jgi:hypothetical protein
VIDEHGWGGWYLSWVWSLPLIAVTIALHSAIVVSISHGSRQFWDAPVRKQLVTGRTTTAIGVIVGVALSLVALHSIEAMLWALAYLQLGAVGTPAGAVLYSLGSMTTLGGSGFALEPKWRMMGALEALNGMMLFGISTAFLFSVMQRLLIPPRGVAQDRT